MVSLRNSIRVFQTSAIVPGLLVILLHHWEYRQGVVMETTGKRRQVEVTKNSLFYCRRITWCSTLTHTHIHTHTPTHPHPHTHTPHTPTHTHTHTHIPLHTYTPHTNTHTPHPHTPLTPTPTHTHPHTHPTYTPTPTSTHWSLITRPEKSYRMWCVWAWSWILDNEKALAHWGLLSHGKHKLYLVKNTNYKETLCSLLWSLISSFLRWNFPFVILQCMVLVLGEVATETSV